MNNIGNQIGILEWPNEGILLDYPLLNTGTFPRDILTDAHFVQFDSTIPVIQNIRVDINFIEFDILFDVGLQTLIVNRSGFAVGQKRVFRDATGRYMGFVILGNGCNVLWGGLYTEFNDVHLSFVPYCTRGIARSSGVYSLDGLKGAVVMNDTDVVYYEGAANTVTFNAIAYQADTAQNLLKTINGQGPVDNTFFINDSDLIRLDTGVATLTFQTPVNLLTPIFII